MNKPRLIDVNELLKWLELVRKDYKHAGACNEAYAVEYIIFAVNEIDTIPTAYDIDKVVEQLEAMQNFEMRTGQNYCPDANEEECRYRYSDLGCSYCAFEKAIEIVKGGMK